jgi:hypothetical protein
MEAGFMLRLKTLRQFKHDEHHADSVPTQKDEVALT